jgi:hypothetical protein
MTFSRDSSGLWGTRQSGLALGIARGGGGVGGHSGNPCNTLPEVIVFDVLFKSYPDRFVPLFFDDPGKIAFCLDPDVPQQGGATTLRRPVVAQPISIKLLTGC